MPTPYDNFQLAQSTAIPQYAGAPVEEFGRMLEKREQDYNANVKALDNLELVAADLNVNDADYSVKMQALEKVKSGIQGIADAGGAYEFAGNQVRGLAKEFTTNQGLKAAVQNQANITSRTEELRKKYDDRKISEIGYKHAIEQLGTYSGVGEGENGIYKGIGDITYEPTRYTDVGKELTNFGVGFKADMASKWYFSADGLWRIKETGKVVKDDDVKIAMLDYAAGSPDIMATVNEYEDITGGDMLTPLVNAQVEKLGFTQFDKDMSVNNYALADYRANLAGKEAGIGGPPIPGATRTEGNMYKSSDDFIKDKVTIATERKELQTQRTRLINSGAEENKLAIAQVEAKEKDLEQREIEAVEYNESIETQARKNLGLTEDYQSTPEFIAKAEQEATDIMNKKRPSARDTQAMAWFIEHQDNLYQEAYQQASINIDPFLAEKERLYDLGGQAKTVYTSTIPPADKKEREAMTAWGTSIVGQIRTKGTLGEKGAEGLGTGIQWFDSEKGGENVSQDELTNIDEELTYKGTSVDPNSGKQVYTFNMRTKAGKMGTVAIGSAEINDYIARTGNQEAYRAIVQPQITAIDKSNSGIGEIAIPGTGKVVQVESLINNPEEALKRGGNYVITVDTENELTGKVEAIPYTFTDRYAAQNFITSLRQ